MCADTFRENIGIAVDGGGIKGAVVAHGIMELERMLGVRALIDSPRIKVVAGTSTGAIIASCIAAGMTGAEMLKLYQDAGELVFSKGGAFRPFGYRLGPLSGEGFSNFMMKFMKFTGLGKGKMLLYPLFPALYSFEPLRQLIKETLQAHPFGAYTNPTLEQVAAHLASINRDLKVIITAVEIDTRRTHFLKTIPNETYKTMPLVEAILASSCIPTYWEPIRLLPEKEKESPLLVDGGVGSFGNPALVVAWEMCQPRTRDEAPPYDPKQTTIISLGTGTVSAHTFHEKHGNPRKWWALQWVRRAIDIFSDTASREQSRTIVTTYKGIDLRRFQVEYTEVIEADRFDLMRSKDGEKPVLIQAGEQLIEYISQDRHALHPDLTIRHDPELITNSFLASQLGIESTPHAFK